jgi:HK97 family phage major capsid protein
MQNIPGFLSFLQARMPQRLLNVEDAETLYGSGTSPHLKGILTAGNYTASTSTSTSLSEAIIDDLATLEDTYERMGTAIILRPIDYWSFFKQKASGSGEYDLPDNFTFQNGTLYVSGVPVYETTALTAGDYVVGDFQDGAQLLIQNPWRLEFSDSDASNFTTNKVTIRIEEDVAFPVYGSTYFIKGVVPTAV